MSLAANAVVAAVTVPVVDADVTRRKNVQSRVKAKKYASLRLRKSKSHGSPSHRVNLKRRVNPKMVMSHAASAVIVNNVMTSALSEPLKTLISSAMALTQQARIQ
jgi:hypothetical protein